MLAGVLTIYQKVTLNFIESNQNKKAFFFEEKGLIQKVIGRRLN